MTTCHTAHAPTTHTRAIPVTHAATGVAYTVTVRYPVDSDASDAADAGTTDVDVTDAHGDGCPLHALCVVLDAALAVLERDAARARGRPARALWDTYARLGAWVACLEVGMAAWAGDDEEMGQAAVRWMDAA